MTERGTRSLEPDAAEVARRRGRLRYYVEGMSTSPAAYLLEQTLYALFAGLPGLLGIGLRALTYRLILHSEGWPAIEDDVRLAQAGNIHLGKGVYLDHGCYLHACPQGIFIGAESFVMHNTELHVYNFRGMTQSGIWIGHKCFIGESTIIRGQGGVRIGDEVLIAPGVKVMAINHLFGDRSRAVMAQGIEAKGITIGDGAWIGAGAIILDGVTVGAGAVIGAGAVVTKSIPPHCVAVGTPAHVVKQIGAEPSTPKRANSARNEGG